MAGIIDLVVLQGEQVLPHRFTANATKDRTEGTQVFQLDGRRTGNDKQQMDRHAIFRTIVDAIPAEAQGNMHFMQAQDLAVGDSHPMANSCTLYAFTTKHTSFEAFNIR